LLKLELYLFYRLRLLRIKLEGAFSELVGLADAFVDGGRGVQNLFYLLCEQFVLVGSAFAVPFDLDPLVFLVYFALCPDVFLPVIEMQQLNPVVGHDIVPTHSLVNGVRRLVASMSVAYFNQKVKQVCSQIEPEVSFEFANDLSELVQSEHVLFFVLEADSEAPHVDPAHEHINPLFATGRNLDLEALLHCHRSNCRLLYYLVHPGDARQVHYLAVERRKDLVLHLRLSHYQVCGRLFDWVDVAVLVK
jgi:hypothetical protein